MLAVPEAGGARRANVCLESSGSGGYNAHELIR
jgi:hypothetical protein